MGIPGFKYSKKHRGQMFILATMLIAVYVVMMTSALMNLGAERIEFDRETLREPYLDSKREIQNYLELILTEYSENGTTLTPSTAITRINDFLNGIETLYSARGVTSEFQLSNHNFNLSAQLAPYGNVSDSFGTVYSSQIQAELHLRMSAVSSTFTIDEAFSIVFIGRVEIQGNKVIIQQSRGKQLENVDASSIYIFNTTHYLIPSSSSDYTGIYYFEGENNLDNLGILNVTLMNGVHILS
ncbi:MAG: hypothetical protein JSW11_06660 [Candidatus Heimdallarchaeota archaeon]|nr:MAG: hypothetical protein JSW11_06660 [Candidatus Heimdallarchaeota archaeon]